MAKEIGKLIQSMNSKYDELNQKQAEFLSMDTTETS